MAGCAVGVHMQLALCLYVPYSVFGREDKAAEPLAELALAKLTLDARAAGARACTCSATCRGSSTRSTPPPRCTGSPSCPSGCGCAGLPQTAPRRRPRKAGSRLLSQPIRGSGRSSFACVGNVHWRCGCRAPCLEQKRLDTHGDAQLENGPQVPGQVVQREPGYQALLNRQLELAASMKPRQLANVVRAQPLPE